jgi:hypothetical protein
VLEEGNSLKSIGESIDRWMSIEMRREAAIRGVLLPLYEAARAKQGGPLAWAAARRLREATSRASTVFISTGHVHPVLFPHGETDGPPGAAVLARALKVGLKARVILLCEAGVTDVLRRACRAAGLAVGDSATDPSGVAGAPRSVSIMPFPHHPEEAQRKACDLLDQNESAAIITIEKIGPNRVGVYHSGVGSDISASLAKVDVLVAEAQRRGVLTIGIGDLGNEIGFGLIQDVVREVVPRANECLCPCHEGIACDVPVDCLVVASVSNWGAYGVVAALAAMTGQLELSHTAEVEKEMIFQCCRAGAVDGSTTGPTFVVDGLSWETHCKMVDILGTIVSVSLSEGRSQRVTFEERQQ